MRSAMASACTRSIRPLRKARSENSPGRAMRAPRAMIRVEQEVHHHCPAMAVQLQHVLAREGMGAGKI